MKTWSERLLAHDKTLQIHLIGIGGAGLSAIAQVLIEQGFRVRGSDRQANAQLARLETQGAQIILGQRAENLTELPADARPDVVLISSAVAATNPERHAAETLGIPVVKRDEFLPVLLQNRQLIAVAGTAGKSTTTAMIVKVLREAGLDIGYIIGTDLPGYGNAAAGRHPAFVLEADEYDHMFLGLRPQLAVITNIVWDHPDCYPTAENFWQAFAQFAALVSANGTVIACADDDGAARLIELQADFACAFVTYGVDEQTDFQATNVMGKEDGVEAALYWQGKPVGQLELATPGVHIIRNALATLAVAHRCGVDLSVALASLRTFAGTARRFEFKGQVNGVTVIDDYAHHPTKVQATLAAARQRFPARRIWGVFQPHTYSRTKQLLAEFAESFAAADQVIVTDIYAARETNDGSIQAQDLVAASAHPAMHYIGKLDDVTEYLLECTRSGDVVVVMGAGDSTKISEQLLAARSQVPA